jgi:hypothetical protein
VRNIEAELIYGPPSGKACWHPQILRYLARGPVGTETLKETDPWAEVRWLVNGWIVTPDKSMIQWTVASGPPTGMPHMSYVPRKPVPLGCEVKCVAHGT